MRDSQKQSIREKFKEFILPETYDSYQGMTFEQVEKITTFWLTLLEEELARQREEVREWLRYAIHNAKGKTADQELARLLRDLKKDDLLTQLEDIEEWVEEELHIQKKVQEKAKEVVVVGRKKVNEMVEDRDIRQGKIEVLSDILSALKEKKDNLN